MATNARPRKAPIAPAPSNERDPNSRPFFTQKVKLQSLHAQQVFDRGFEICADAVFSLTVVLRIYTVDAQAREVEGVVDERITKMFDDMRAEVTRLERLAEANGIEFVGVTYSHPKDVSAIITSPRAVRYLGIIREFDDMTGKLDTLWLSGVIPDGIYSSSVYDWKRRLLRLSGGIRGLAVRAISAAKRKKGADIVAEAKAESVKEPVATATAAADDAPVIDAQIAGIEPEIEVVAA